MNKVSQYNPTYLPKELSDIFENCKNNEIYQCELAKSFNCILEKMCLKPISELNENDNKHEEYNFCNVNRGFYCYVNESNAEYWKSDSSCVRRNERSRQDFYRISSQDNRFESGNAEIHDIFYRFMNGLDYCCYGRRKASFKYVQISVKTREICLNKSGCETHSGSIGLDNIYYHEDYSNIRHTCLSEEENNEEEQRSSVDKNGNRAFHHTQLRRNRKMYRKNEFISESKRNEHREKISSLNQRLDNREETVSLKKINNLDYLANFSGKQTSSCSIEATLKMSKLSQTMKIRTCAAATINGTEEERAKSCARSKLRFQSADNAPAKLTAGYLHNEDYNLVYTYETIRVVIDVSIEEVTYRQRSSNNILDNFT